MKKIISLLNYNVFFLLLYIVSLFLYSPSGSPWFLRITAGITIFLIAAGSMYKEDEQKEQSKWDISNDTYARIAGIASILFIIGHFLR